LSFEARKADVGIAISWCVSLEVSIVHPSLLAKDNLIQETRQSRLVETDAVGIRIEVEAQAGLQQKERRRCCPRLWRASDRMGGRALRALP
jgi:hypothetical protein